MKKATVCHPGGEKTTIEIAGLQDIFQKGDSQQSATNHSNRTAFSKELQRISEVYDGHVLVLVLPMVDSAVNVYVVPVDPEESGAVEISAEKIRLTARRKFGIDISSLGPLHEESRPATDINEKTFSLGSVLVATCPQPTDHKPPDSEKTEPVEDSKPCDGTSWSIENHTQQSSSYPTEGDGVQYKHEEQFQPGSPEEVMLTSESQVELHWMEDRREMGCEVLSLSEQESQSSHSEDVGVQRDFFNSVSVDITPAFLSSPNDNVQDFIKQGIINEDATLIRRLSSLSISFDLTPAFLSFTPEDQQTTFNQQHAQPITDRTDSSIRVEIDPEVSHRVQSTRTSGSGQSIPSQCTPPGRVNNSLFVFHCPSRPPEGNCILIPAPKHLSCLPPGNDRQQIRFVYPSLEPAWYLLPDVTCSGFPSREELRLLPDYTIIYSSSIFVASTHLSCGMDCRNIFPSPLAIHRAVEKIPVPLQNEYEVHRCNLTPHHSDSVILPRSVFLGVGGNGIVLKHILKDRKYAVKWMKYSQKELNAWYQLSHPNLVPLCAVVWVTPGCYQVMPRMSGDLSYLVRSDSAGDLSDLALSVDEATWTETLKPNIQFILASILHGLAYLHSQGFQHCDLKESNILFLLKCNCASILLCKCSSQNKFTIAIGDFDSIKPFSSGSPCKISSTPFYRPPEAYQGLVGPFGDIWSFGIIVCSLCHSYNERQKIIQKCKLMTGRYLPMPNSLPPEELFYSQQILLSLQVKSSHTPLSWHDIAVDVLETRLTSLTRIAVLCLECDYKERPSVAQLLQDPFFH